MRALLRCALFATLLVTGSVNVWAADGRIFAFEGDVQVNGQAVTDTTELNANDTIVTGPGASVKILLADNSVLDLDSDTSIKISDYNYDPAQPQENTSEVEIVQGTLRYVSGLIAKENHEDIGFTAGNSTIGVRGSYTEIEMSGMVVNVEALIGEAIVVIDDDDCPDKTYVVRTGEVAYTDPLPQALVLTAIVISFGMTAVVAMIALGAFLSSRDDSINLSEDGTAAGDDA